MFLNRQDAARQLLPRLAHYKGQHPLVLAIPRGAVPMGHILARELQGDWDVVLVRKLRAPGNPEFAIGAVDESGTSYLSPEAAHSGAHTAYIAQELKEQMATMARRRARYTPLRSPIDPQGRVVIVVDDGLATGSTMMAALRALRQRHPARLVCAVPVASPEALMAVAPLADEVVCLMSPPHFQSVGQFYADFTQVEDEDVESLLRSVPPL